MSKHTSAPWRVERTANGCFWVHKGILKSIGLIGHDTAEADATHIVKCVNLHDELVQTLGACLDEFESKKDCCCDGTEDGAFACYFHRIEHKIKMMLAKAKVGVE